MAYVFDANGRPLALSYALGVDAVSAVFMADSIQNEYLVGGGIGANTAVRDSALLGRLLAQNEGWKDGVTRDYEKEMRVYGTQAVKSSYGMATSAFGVSIDEKTSPVVGG